MSIIGTVTILWTPDNGDPAKTFSINNATLNSLESFRLNLNVYPDILTMVVDYLATSLLAPAFNAFPTPGIQTAATALANAQASLVLAQTAVTSATAAAMSAGIAAV
jgi:hypothetical protein